MRHASVRWLVMGSFMALASAGILATAQETPGAADVPEPMPVSDGTKVCLVCHGAKSDVGMGIYPAIAMQWEGSRHARRASGVWSATVCPRSSRARTSITRAT